MDETSGEAWYPGKGSTGPRTAEGKDRVARNAVKHGLCAKKYVFTDEDADAFHEYRIELMNELAPLGSLETFYADRIAGTTWRLQRIMPAEAEMFDHQRAEASGGLCTVGAVFARPSFGGPSGVAKLGRYETQLDRMLSRALRELRILQAERGAVHPDLLCEYRGPSAGIPASPHAREESAAERAARTLPREQVEAMIRDGVVPHPGVLTPGLTPRPPLLEERGSMLPTVPVFPAPLLPERGGERSERGEAPAREETKEGAGGAGSRAQAFDLETHSGAEMEISKQSPRRYAASRSEFSGTG